MCGVAARLGHREPGPPTPAGRPAPHSCQYLLGNRPELFQTGGELCTKPGFELLHVTGRANREVSEVLSRFPP